MIAPALPVASTPSPIVRDYVSWSAINTYRQCPQKYKFHYLDQLPEEFLNATLVFGQAIHAGLEAYFRHLLSSGHSLGVDAVLAAYHEHWASVDLAKVRFGAHDDVAALSSLAERMFAVFLASDLAQPAGAIIAIEDEWRSPLVEDVPDLLARLDLVIDQGDAVVITDFKTSRGRWSAADVEAAAGQLLLYGEIVRQEVARPVRLQFAVLTKTKQPDLQLHAVETDERRVGRQQGMVRRVWRSIQGGHFYPHPSAMNCPTCPYQTACAAWTG